MDEETRQQVTQQLRSWGYEPHLFSVAAGTGLAKLGELLSDQVTVIAGSVLFMKTKRNPSLLPFYLARHPFRDCSLIGVERRTTGLTMNQQLR